MDANTPLVILSNSKPVQSDDNVVDDDDDDDDDVVVDELSGK